MSLQEKYQEYKQRKEAKAFFNKNNSEKVSGKDYLIAFLVGTGVSIVLGFLMEWITSVIGINFTYITILVGILEATAIKRVLNKSGNNLAILAIVSYVFGILIAQTMYMLLYLPIFNFSIFFAVFIGCFKALFIGDFLGTVVILFGAIAAYMVLKD